MASLGDILRTARERKGISIAEASTATGIGARYIAGLESERFELLPARVYARAYLRAYAGYLGLDPDPLLDGLDELWMEPLPPEVIPVSRPLSGPPIITGQMIMIVVFLVLVGVLLGYVYNQYASFLFSSQPQGPAAEATPRMAQAPFATGVTPRTTITPAQITAGPVLPTELPSTPIPTATPTPSDLTLEIRITQTAWVNVEVDGKEVLNATLQPGATYKWTAKEKVFIWSGFAGGVRVFRNGVDDGLLGDGVVRVVWAAPSWRKTPLSEATPTRRP